MNLKITFIQLGKRKDIIDINLTEENSRLTLDKIYKINFPEHDKWNLKKVLFNKKIYDSFDISIYDIIKSNYDNLNEYFKNDKKEKITYYLQNKFSEPIKVSPVIEKKNSRIKRLREYISNDNIRSPSEFDSEEDTNENENKEYDYSVNLFNNQQKKEEFSSIGGQVFNPSNIFSNFLNQLMGLNKNNNFLKSSNDKLEQEELEQKQLDQKQLEKEIFEQEQLEKELEINYNNNLKEFNKIFYSLMLEAKNNKYVIIKLLNEELIAKILENKNNRYLLLNKCLEIRSDYLNSRSVLRQYIKILKLNKDNNNLNNLLLDKTFYKNYKDLDKDNLGFIIFKNNKIRLKVIYDEFYKEFENEINSGIYLKDYLKNNINNLFDNFKNRILFCSIKEVKKKMLLNNSFTNILLQRIKKHNIDKYNEILETNYLLQIDEFKKEQQKVNKIKKELQKLSEELNINLEFIKEIYEGTDNNIDKFKKLTINDIENIMLVHSETGDNLSSITSLYFLCKKDLNKTLKYSKKN